MSRSDTPKRILVVDDDASFSEALGVTLCDAGFEVECAASPAEGGRLARARAFDLLIADLHMPGNEHFEWIREVAARHPGMPVVVVTGSPSLETAVDAVRLPVMAYLVKPVDPVRLLAEVSSVLERAAAPRESIERALARKARRWGLSSRQCEVLAELVNGASNKEIATRLGCTVRTVEDHLGVLFRKAGVESRSALVARFWRGG